MATGAALIDTPEQLVAVTHPTRLRILDELRSRDSAAGVARRLGETRQRINHHVRELAKAGLLVSAGERRSGNFVEQLYESAAGTFVLSPRITWSDGARVRALADQLSLRHLIEFGERLVRDAVSLLDRASFESEEISTATAVATVRFADDAERSAFLDDYLRLTAELIDKYAAVEGDDYTVGLVVHPTVREDA